MCNPGRRPRVDAFGAEKRYHLRIFTDVSMPATLQKLRWAVECAHGCKARFAGVARVHEKQNGRTVWYGSVHIFDLIGHDSARQAYAWSIDAFGGNETQIVTVLRQGRVSGPEEAVKAALDRATREQSREA